MRTSSSTGMRKIRSAFLVVTRATSSTDSPLIPAIRFATRGTNAGSFVFPRWGTGARNGLSVEDVARVTTRNALRIFRIPVDEEVRIAYRIRNSLYLNITNRCTNVCTFCAKRGDFHVKGHYLKLPGEPGVDQVIAEAGDPAGYDEIVFCGFGEPLLRLREVKEIAGLLKTKGAKIRVNTDGLANLVHGRNVLPELRGLVDALSVSLNAPDAATYARICPNRYGEASFPALLDFLRQAPAFVPSVTATAVALPGLDHDAVRRLAESIEGVSFRLRDYNDVG